MRMAIRFGHGKAAKVSIIKFNVFELEVDCIYKNLKIGRGRRRFQRQWRSWWRRRHQQRPMLASTFETG